MFGDANWPHARPPPSVRNAKGLVQIEMADISADIAGAAEADLGVHVRAVHIDLAAVGVDDAADVHNGFLEDAVSGGISDHEGGQFAFMGGGFGFQISEADV